MNKEWSENLISIFNEIAPIAQYFGMKLSYNEEGSAMIDLPYNPHLDHAAGGIHGGVYATMLDNAGWFTAAVSHDEPTLVVTSEITIHFFLPAKKTALRAIGKLIKKGKRQDIVEMDLLDAEENLIAHGIGTFVIIGEESFPIRN